jgi:UDP-N-acetyl-D-glucosamine dehydrogenase
MHRWSDRRIGRRQRPSRGSERIRGQALSVGIVGLGHVGLSLAVSFAEAGELVIGVEINPGRVAQLRRGESYVPDIPSTCLQVMRNRIEVSTDSAALARADAILICVPTPLTANGEPDLSPLIEAGRAVARVLRRGHIVVLESAVGPGTTRERLVPILEESGLVAGRDFNLAFSPDRVDPGRQDHTLRTTPKIVSGLTDACATRAEALYGLVCNRVIRASRLEVGELANLLESVFRCVNVALVNEVARLAEQMDVDIWEVVDVAATKPFGFMRFDPGPGTGGSCLAVDPVHLASAARRHGVAAELIELAGRANRQTPYACVERIERALDERDLAVQGSHIAILGVSYKGGVDDTHDSAALEIAAQLTQRGATLSYHDPYVRELPALGLRSRSLGEIVDACDLAVIVTAHPGVDHRGLAERMPIVDLRGATRSAPAEPRRLRPLATNPPPARAA